MERLEFEFLGSRRSFFHVLDRLLIGAPDWNRTSGLSLRSASLYPTELRAHSLNVYFRVFHPEEAVKLTDSHHSERS